jgi:hypothetical protein
MTSKAKFITIWQVDKRKGRKYFLITIWQVDKRKRKYLDKTGS